MLLAKFSFNLKITGSNISVPENDLKKNFLNGQQLCCNAVTVNATWYRICFCKTSGITNQMKTEQVLVLSR